MLKMTFVIALLGLISPLVGCQDTVSDAKIAYMDVSKAKERLSKDSDRKDIAILDARSRADFDAGHIPGAIHMTPAALPVAEGKTGSGEVVLIDKDLILIYGSDAGSQIPRVMAKRLLLLSYDDVYVLQGGMREWVRLGGTVSQSSTQ